MKTRPKEPSVPRERQETLRREIIGILKDRSLSAKDISMEIGIPQVEVTGHLEHIQRTMHKHGLQLVVDPACCVKCGFIFKKRERLKKPGKCPVCRGEQITEPLFSVRQSNRH